MVELNYNCFVLVVGVVFCVVFKMEYILIVGFVIIVNVL